MKKYLFVLLMGWMMGKISAQESVTEEQNTTRKNHFLFSPFNFIWNNFQVAYERDYTKSRNSSVVEAGLLLNKKEEGLKFGLNTGVFYKFKLIRRNVVSRRSRRSENTVYYHEYIYLSPYLQYNYFMQEHPEQTYRVNGYPVSTTYTIPAGTDVVHSLSTGVIVGVRWTLSKRVDVELYGGGGIRYSEIFPSNEKYNDDYGRNPFDIGFTGVYPRGGLRLGVAF